MKLMVGILNLSLNQTSYILENETVLQQSYLNKNNFEQVSKSQFSFLNFEDSTETLSFEPYEIKLIQVS